MQLSRLSRLFLGKILLAAVLISLLAAVAGAQLAPTLPMSLVLLYSAAGALVLFLLLVIATVAALTFAQFILRKGGTDPQWFWFAAEPPGLVQLREQARASKAQARAKR
jgi:hypothetical protein